MQKSDQQIISDLRNSKNHDLAFQALVDKYQERLYWHIRKMVIDHDDTDDILQDVFIKVWKNIEKFREDSNLFTWLYKIATNECLNFLKRRKDKYKVPMEDANQELYSKLDNSPHISGSAIQKKLQKALLGLPDKQRLVFNMKYFDEMKYEDISAVLETSVGALKASYHHALKKIEQYLTED